MGHRGNPMMMGGGNFSPPNLAGVVAWWDSTDASKMTRSGSQIVTWTDKISGVVLTGQGASASSIVASTLNGRQAISFPGATAYMNNPATPANYPIDPAVDDAFVFAAMQVSSGSSSGFAPSVVGVGGKDTMGITGPSNTTSPSPGFLQLTNSGAYDYWEDDQSINSISAVCEIRYGTAGVPQGYVNGTLAHAGVAITPSAGLTSGAIEVGRRMGSAEYLGGLVGDIIIAKNLSTSDRQKLEGYLAWKFGLQGSLPGGHPYKPSPP